MVGNTLDVASVSPLLVTAAAAWSAVVVVAIRMSAMSMRGTMGLGPVPFGVVWALMMIAMMLPSVVPFVLLYQRRFRSRRIGRTAALAAGYLLVWSATAVPAYALATVVDRSVNGSRTAGTVLAFVIFAGCGVYQFTSFKERCLAHCRSPLALVMQYSGMHGRTADARAAVRHGAYCVACCWALMALLIAFGIMNVWAMVVLSAIIILEKMWVRGRGFARAVGVVAIGCAVAALFTSAVAPGLAPVTHAMSIRGM